MLENAPVVDGRLEGAGLGDVPFEGTCWDGFGLDGPDLRLDGMNSCPVSDVVHCTDQWVELQCRGEERPKTSIIRSSRQGQTSETLMSHVTSLGSVVSTLTCYAGKPGSECSFRLYTCFSVKNLGKCLVPPFLFRR
jgi:hypothetical protein